MESRSGGDDIEHASEVLSIIEAGMEGDKKKLKAYAELLMTKLPDDDHLKKSINREIT